MITAALELFGSWAPAAFLRAPVTIGSIVIAMYLPLFTMIGKLSRGH